VLANQPIHPIPAAALAPAEGEPHRHLANLFSRIYKLAEISGGFRLLVSGSLARGRIVFD
jgi:hypothetical protein